MNKCSIGRIIRLIDTQTYRLTYSVVPDSLKWLLYTFHVPIRFVLWACNVFQLLPLVPCLLSMWHPMYPRPDSTKLNNNNNDFFLFFFINAILNVFKKKPYVVKFQLRIFRFYLSCPVSNYLDRLSIWYQVWDLLEKSRLFFQVVRL